MLSDVKRAYFHAPAERELYVELPPEDKEYGTGKVGRLNLSLYGTRDAAANWQRCVADHLRSIGFTQGKSNPCVFYHEKKNLRTLVHGDDYASVGSLEHLAWLKKHLEDRFEMKTVLVGHSSEPGVVREAKILNRVVRANDAGWEYECDQRHVEIILEHLKLTEAKLLSTPGVEETTVKSSEDDAEIPLSAPEVSLYRAVVARANYI